MRIQGERGRFLWTALVLALSLAALVYGNVQAQTPGPTPSDDEVNAIASEMYCPVCENVPLDVCSTQACAQWRALIRQKLSEGWTKAEIEDYFVAQYGDRVLAEPPRRGLNWLVYVLPPLFFLLGAWVLVRVLRGMRRAPAPQPPPAWRSEDPYVARMEEELRKRE